MKLNISFPPFRSQKLIEVDDERKLRAFYDKRISEEVNAEILGDEWKGYVFKISGGHDKQGFSMKQGVLTNNRVRLLLDGTSGHYHPDRPGERRRKSVRGCIVGSDLAVIALVVVRRGPQDIAGLTDPGSDKPSTRAPKRANSIRKVYGLGKKDDVRLFVPHKTIKRADGKKDVVKRPKIQRLVTPRMLQHKRRRIALKKHRATSSAQQKAEYTKLVTQLRKESRAASASKKASSKGQSDKPAAKK